MKRYSDVLSVGRYGEAQHDDRVALVPGKSYIVDNTDELKTP